MKQLLSFPIRRSWRQATALVAGFLFCLHLQGQSIVGKVMEQNGSPLPSVNVLLLNSTDSSLVKGAVSDTLGNYIFDNVHQGSYLLSASMIGYQAAYLSPFKMTTSSVPLQVGNLTLAETTQQLQEVAITAQRPFVEQQIDRTIVNVANSIIASGGTAWEVLEKAPGVTVDRQNDQLQLLGKNGVILQIDGKQTYLSMTDVVAMLKACRAIISTGLN